MATARGWLAVLLSVFAVGTASALGSGFDPGAPSGGGGTTVGAAVSGGTASRFLVTDSSGNVATPNLFTHETDGSTYSILQVNGPDATSDPYVLINKSAAAQSGTLLFATDYPTTAATGGNPRWNIQNRSDGSLSFRRNDGVGEAEVLGFTNAAAVNVAGATTLASTADIRGAISNGGSATCNSLGTAGAACVNDAEGMTVTGGLLNVILATAPQVIARSTSASVAAAITLQTSGASTGMSMAYGNSSVGAPFTSKGYFVTVGTPIMMANTNANALNTEIFQWYDATSSTAQKLWTMDGEGTLQSHLSTTLGAGDCDADAEVGRIRRYGKDANNITLCGCQRVGGVFGWAAMITGGDCT